MTGNTKPGAELAAMRRTETKQCPECGETFTGLVKTQYCKRCRNKLNVRQFREKRRAEMRKSIIAYDNSAIYGIKYSASGAIKDAKENGADITNLKTAEASEALARHVNKFGGDVGFSVESDGIAYLITDEGELI